jgi:hypothetical protein
LKLPYEARPCLIDYKSGKFHFKSFFFFFLARIKASTLSLYLKLFKLFTMNQIPIMTRNTSPDLPAYTCVALMIGVLLSIWALFILCAITHLLIRRVVKRIKESVVYKVIQSCLKGIFFSFSFWCSFFCLSFLVFLSFFFFFTCV